MTRFYDRVYGLLDSLMMGDRFVEEMGELVENGEFVRDG